MKLDGTKKDRKNLCNLMMGASILGLSLMMSSAISAQDDDVATDEVVATGIRQSILDAQDIKRNADTFVDAITASDIGALPDRSVSEALQRVPGVNILRFSSPNDPDHFSVEGSGVVIRGLPFVRSELNGRDVFGANSGGVLGFEDVSPELLGAVKVFKNQSADLIEGGIAGTIDLNTRLPFDDDGFNLSYSLELNYGDKAERTAPTGSVLWSNTWDTNAGRFGLLGNLSASELISQADSTQISAFSPATDAAGNDVFIPAGGGIRRQDFERDRRGIALAGQWESPDQAWLATAQFLRSDSTLEWGENVVQTQADGTGDRNGFDQSDFVFDEDGVFQTGTIVDNSQWRGPAATAALLPSTGGQQQASTRNFLEENETDDFGFNLKYVARDNLRFNFDAQYVQSENEVTDTEVIRSFFSQVAIGAEDNSVPTVTFLPSEGESADFFSSPDSQFIRALAEQRTSNDAESLSFRGDVEYDFSGDGWLKSARAGVRYSDQDTDIRESDFNWGNISEVWTGRDINNTAIQPDGSFSFDAIESIFLLGGNTNPALNDAVSGFFGAANFDGFQRGDTLGGLNGLQVFTGPDASNFEAFEDFRRLLLDVTGGSTGTRAFCGAEFVPLADRVCTNGDQIIPGTPFTEAEVTSVTRENFAAYTRLDFGTEDLAGNGITLDGNIGLRVVRTERVADSVQLLPTFAGLFDQTVPEAQPDGSVFDPCDAVQAAERDSDIPGACALDLAALQTLFGTGNVVRVPVEVNYTEFLPSLNLKFGLDEDRLIRLAVSRTLTRPTTDEINQRPAVGTFPDVENLDGTNTFGGFIGNFSGNAQLLPQTAWNFDASYEWYFSDTGSLTLSGFYKTIDNFVTQGALSVPNPDGGDLLIGGQPVAFNTNINSDETATISGFEVAYSQFYDFLPAPFDGLGIQANYTYIDADGVSSQVDEGLFVGPASDGLNPAGPNFAVDDGIFPRVSDHNVNLVGLYEKGRFQGRLAYNWRSDFLLTPRDVIFPFSSIYQESTGQLDGSVFITLNDAFKVGFQAVNLLDDVTETTQTISEDGLRAPRSFIRNDRRFSAILRASF
ncbi:MAG: TonB-dependent receptor [Maricaulaceae bacterium]